MAAAAAPGLAFRYRSTTKKKLRKILVLLREEKTRQTDRQTERARVAVAVGKGRREK